MNDFSNSAADRQRLEKFFEDWIYHKSAKGKSWNKVWVVIRGHFMFAFKSRHTHKPDQLIGYLLLNYQTVCKNRGDDKPGRYKFDVHTIDRGGKMMHNRFRCETRPERDLWRGYIIGLATGRIPEDVPLTPSQLHAIASAVERLQNNSTNRPSPASVPPPVSSNGSTEFVNGNGTMMLSNGIRSVSGASSASSSGGSGSRPSIQQMREVKHRFYEDPELNFEDPPSWFVEVCNRDRAEQILEYGQSYGSVMMRESTTFRDSGSYTISMRNFPGSSTRFSHFQVMRVARGYKIQFDYEHEPLACLSDIMAYFVSVSGTQPLRTNDVDLLLSATAKPNNGMTLQKNVSQNGHFNGNCNNSHINNSNGGGGSTMMMNLSRKDSAMDIVNDAFQFLDNKSCISLNSNGIAQNFNGRGFCDCEGDGDGLDDCHYSVTGDDENGNGDSGDGIIIENSLNVSAQFSSVSHANNQNGTISNRMNNSSHFNASNHNHHNYSGESYENNTNGSNSRFQNEPNFEEDSTTPVNGGKGAFFQSELTARLSRRKEVIEPDCVSNSNIPLLSSTLQTRAVPPPPPPPPDTVGVECDETDELYVNSDDVIAHSITRSYTQECRVQQQPNAPRLPPRPANFTFESCSAELVEKLQRRLQRIPDA